MFTVSSKLTFVKLDMSEKLMILFTAENNKDILVEFSSYLFYWQECNTFLGNPFSAKKPLNTSRNNCKIGECMVFYMLRWYLQDNAQLIVNSNPEL